MHTEIEFVSMVAIEANFQLMPALIAQLVDALEVSFEFFCNRVAYTLLSDKYESATGDQRDRELGQTRAAGFEPGCLMIVVDQPAEPVSGSLLE